MTAFSFSYKINCTKLLALFIVFFGFASKSWGQVVWSNANGTNFLNTSNWTGGATPGTSSVAEFNTKLPGSPLGIDFSGGGGATNTGGTNEELGAIYLTSSVSGAITIDNSTSTAGTITLGGPSGVGATVNGTNNAILSNLSGSTFTLQNGTSGSMGISVGTGSTSLNIVTAGSSGNAVGTNITISSAISGSAPLIFLGNGTYNGSTGNTGGILELSGTNTYTSNITIGNSDGTSNGIVQFDATGALKNNNVTVNTFNQLFINVSSGTFSTTGTLTLNGPGNNGSGNYGQGAIRTNSGNTIIWTGPISLASNATIAAVGSTGSITAQGAISGTGQLQKQGSGNLILTSGSNSWSGGTLIGNGTITVNSGSSISTGALTMGQTSTNNTALTLNNATQTVGSLSSSWITTTGQTQAITLTGCALTVNQTSSLSYGNASTSSSTSTATITGTGSLIKTGSANLTLNCTGTMFTGGLTVNSGQLIFNPIGTSSTNVTLSSPVTLGGGTLSTVGMTTGSPTIAFGTLNLSSNSTIALDLTNAHKITFSTSNGVSWTSGQTLTITGWKTTNSPISSGVAGTTGRIFVGSSSSALTASQLAQIQFSNINGGTNTYSAILLSSGELVPCTTNVAFTNTSPATGFVVVNTTNNVLQSFNLAVSTAATTITGLKVTTAGTYASTDLTNLKCWYSTSSTFSSGTATLLSTANSPGGNGTTVTFPSFISQLLSSGASSYIYITADIPSTATLGNTISLGTTAFSNFTFGTVTGTSGTNPIAASNTQTIGNYKYQTRQSGSWTSNTAGSETWQRSLDNSTWVTVTSPIPTPDYTDDTITILSGHAIALPSNLTVDQLTITGELDVNSGIVVTANDGTGTDITVNGTLDFGSSGSLTGSGNIAASAGSTLKTANSNGLVGSSGSIQNSPTTTNSYSSTATIIYNGTAQTITATPSGPHLTLSNSGNKTLAGTIACNNLTISSSAVLVGGSNTINVSGNWSDYGTAGFTEGKSTVVFNGTGSAQSLSCSGGEDFTNLTMNATTGLTLTSDSVRVDSMLSLTKGTLTTNGILKINLKRGEIAYNSGDAGSISGNLLAWKNELSLGNHYISAPVTGATVSGLANYTQIINPYSSDTRLYSYNGSSWQAITNMSTVFTSLEGYSLYYLAPTTFAFYGGYSHSASYSLNFSNSSSNYQLVGNPYPSTSDWTLWTRSGVNNAVYYWDSGNNRYANYVFGAGTNTATQHIPAMQGFFVQTDGSGGTATLSATSTTRETSVSSLWRESDAPVQSSSLKLMASNKNHSDELVVRFMQGATANFDGQYDAVKFMNSDSTPSFYSVLKGSDYSINSLPDTSAITIPLSFVPTFNSTYTISVSSIQDGDSSYAYILTDTLMHISQNLREDSSYTFKADTTDNTSRFYLNAFRVQSPSNVTSTISFTQQKVVISASQKTIRLFFSNIGSQQLSFEVYDVLGQEQLSVTNAKVSSGVYTYPAEQLQTGVYIVRLQLGSQLYTGKIVLE